MSFPLGELLRGLDARIEGDATTEISGVAYHSRRVIPGVLFVALRGSHVDGHDFLGEAIGAGAAALLVEDRPTPRNVPAAVVRDTRAALAEVAARFYGNPGAALRLIGVTGTNGKTSTVRMIESILTRAGRRVGSSGTISVRLPGAEEPAELTTPESLDLQRTLARMREAGVEDVVLEVSSHSLAQGRIRPLRFAAAVCTNLSQDHLDYHGTMEAYAQAKAELFGPVYLDGVAVVPAGPGIGDRLARQAREIGRRVVSFARGSSSEGCYRTRDEQVGIEGSSFEVVTAEARHTIRVPLPGDFQIDNALAALATTHVLGASWAAIREGLAGCPPIPGRLERVGRGDPVVLVDYAHTPDALERVLGRVRPLVSGRLITLFGCGGDRDRTKRVPMAEAACRHSDHVIATSDNPRGEPPEAILEEIRPGLSGSYEIIIERRDAIRQAIALAGKRDTVVIAGKGHESYQLIGGQRRAFDDRVEARAALQARGIPA
ncbi:MAG: UDP-N-acetylmuramoyl-L-alanyl-D-glutamate--2,6-diaminopimelate ligase [Myxococcota bacterium]